MNSGGINLIFYMLFSIIFICGFHRNLQVKRIGEKKSEKKYIFLISIILILIAVLRHESVGSDVSRYCEHFKVISKLEWSSISLYYKKDVFFYYCTKLVTLVTENQQIWLGAIATIYVSSHSYIIEKYSKDALLSYILLLSMGWYHFSLTGLRQAVALGIIAYSYVYLLENKRYKFIITILIASLFHSSAVVFLVAYPVSKLKLGMKQVFITTISLLSLTFGNNYIEMIFSFIFETDRYSGYSNSDVTLSMSMYILIVIIYCYAAFYLFKSKKQDVINEKLFNILTFGMVFQLYSSVLAEMFRVALYFNISILCLLPNILCTYEQNIKAKNLIKVLIYTSFVIYFFSSAMYSSGVYPYEFFWNN